MSNSSKHSHIFRGFPSTSRCSVCFGAIFSIPYRNTQSKSWELFGRHPKSVDGLWDSHASRTRNFKEQWRRPPSFQITSLLITSAWVISQKSDFIRLGIFRSSQNLLTLHPRLETSLQIGTPRLLPQHTHLQVFKCVSKGSSMHSGATRQARPLQLRGRARDKRTEAIQQSHLRLTMAGRGWILSGYVSGRSYWRNDLHVSVLLWGNQQRSTKYAKNRVIPHSESGKLKVRIGIFENNVIKHVIV